MLGDVSIHVDDIGFRPDHAPVMGNRPNGIDTEILHPIPIAVVVDLLPTDRELPLSVVGAFVRPCTSPPPLLDRI